MHPFYVQTRDISGEIWREYHFAEPHQAARAQLQVGLSLIERIARSPDVVGLQVQELVGPEVSTRGKPAYIDVILQHDVHVTIQLCTEYSNGSAQSPALQLRIYGTVPHTRSLTLVQQLQQYLDGMVQLTGD